MTSNSNPPFDGRVPPAGISSFSRIFGKRSKGSVPAPAQTRPARSPVHEKESSLPATLVPGLQPAPRRAAAGDDDLMSQPQPAKPAAG